MTKLWEKQDYETTHAYSAFCIYRDTPAHERSLRKQATQFYGVEGSAKQRQFQIWSAKNHWVERVTAYDVHLDEINRKAQERAIIKMNERQAKLGFDMQEKGWKGIERSEPNVEEGRKLVETGTKIERTARGEASIEVNTNISGELKTGITLDPDIAKQVGKLIAKMESETETEESSDLETEEKSH
ncbi:MAG: hypothetical protein SVK08_01095 [Halobacteriota archaeon]|nr:hypothetical protein [Halobacteriota archaeon]